MVTEAIRVDLQGIALRCGLIGGLLILSDVIVLRGVVASSGVLP